MRKLIVISVTVLFFGNSIIAQDNFVRSFSFATAARYNFSTGNSFLTKGYKSRPGFEIETQFNYRKFLVGLNFQKTYDKISDYNLIGYFDQSEGFSIHPFIGYRQNIVSNKVYFEHRIGIGYKEIKNKMHIDNYATTGTVISVGTRLNYKLNEHFNAYTGLDFNYTKYDVILDGPYHDFYTRSYQVSPLLGIKFLFGTARK